MNSTYQLVVRKGPEPGQVFHLLSITTTIGRDPISDISINDPEVSRQHARLTQTNDSYQIEDLESTNGTFVNGIQMGAAPVQLAHGNEIQLGSGVTMIYELTPVIYGIDDDDDDELSLETAVPDPIAEDPEIDPMLPPDFDDISVTEDPPVPELEESVLDAQDEMDAAFAYEDVPPLPPPEIPRITIPGDAMADAPPANDSNPARRLFAIGAMLILLMMCCCCGFLFFMYQWGGDWLLQQGGLIP